MKLPVIKPREAIKAFQKAGWYIDHQTGSHVIMCHQDNRPTTLSIPRHQRDMSKGLLSGLIKDAGLTYEQFTELLS
ncbi:MAG: type II toxin-antitoxin system HicA family toxin [Dehalococcoidia bacterium]